MNQPYALCTLFDRQYLLKGLALHRSLRQHGDDFVLWVLCMDDLVYDVLAELSLPSVRLIRLAEFETPELRRVKDQRSVAEYCWTCASALTDHLAAENPGLDSIAYVDADIFFFSSLRPLYRDLESGSVLIIPHRYSAAYRDWEASAGRFNVSLVMFRADDAGRACLRNWRDQSLASCRLDPTSGQYGDQKYLDDWPEQFPGIVIADNPGAGLAPWNIHGFRLRRTMNGVEVDGSMLIFHHFHALRIARQTVWGIHPVMASVEYRFNHLQRTLVYRPYLRAIRAALGTVRNLRPGFDSGFADMGWKELLHAARHGNLMLL